MATESNSSLDHKFEILTEQVGRLTGGLTEFRIEITESMTEFRRDLAEIKAITQQQAETAQVLTTNITHMSSDMAELKELVRSQAEAVRQQSEVSQQHVETVARLSRIVEQLLQTKIS